MEELKPSFFRRAAEEAFKKYIPTAACGASVNAKHLLALLEKGKSYENYKFDSYLLFLVASALLDIPEINVRWEGEGNEAKIIKYNDLDLGLAMIVYKDGEPGTAVAKIKAEGHKGETKSAWHLNMRQLNKIILELSEKALNGRLSVKKDLYPPPNIFLNNLGVYRNMDFGVPLLSGSASIMISTFRARPTPVVVEGCVLVQPMMDVMVTFDHRLFDGMIMDKFLEILKNKIENPRF